MSSSFSHSYRNKSLVLGALAGRVTEPTDIARTEKALINVNAGSLYFPILYEGVEIGSICIGTGQVIVDAIVETKRGAIGQSHEFLWNGSLIILTEDGKWSPPSVASIKEKELKTFHLESTEEAHQQAQQILDQFMNRNTCWFTDTFIQKHKGWIVTIYDEEHGKCGIIASEDRLVFKMGETKIIIHGNKLVESIGRRKVLVAGPHGRIVRFG